MSAASIAWLTIRTLSRTIPPALPGIMFLSGGQSEEDAAVNLNEMNKVEAIKPWNLSFSFGRALQKSCLAEWLGNEDNVKTAQRKLLEVAEVCAQATEGKYKGGVASKDDLHVNNYTY